MEHTNGGSHQKRRSLFILLLVLAVVVLTSIWCFCNRTPDKISLTANGIDFGEIGELREAKNDNPRFAYLPGYPYAVFPAEQVFAAFGYSAVWTGQEELCLSDSETSVILTMRPFAEIVIGDESYPLQSPGQYDFFCEFVDDVLYMDTDTIWTILNELGASPRFESDLKAGWVIIESRGKVNKETREISPGETVEPTIPVWMDIKKNDQN